MEHTKFGRLTFLEHAADAPGIKGSDRKRWLMKCDCGAIVTKGARTVQRGQTVSCGCFKIDLQADRHRTHGGSYCPEYRIWVGMKSRCNNPKHRYAKHYSLRGIAYCPQWASFETFFKDMGPRPTPLHTLDRIDNDKGYSPENCRWATRKTQQGNRRVTLTFPYQGQQMVSVDIAAAVGIPHRTMHRRLKKGESVERIVATHHKTRSSAKLSA